MATKKKQTKTVKKQPVKKKTAKKKSKKNVGGRPTKYKPEYLAVMYKVTELGGTDKDVIAAIGVSERSLNSWKKKYPEVSAALNQGKDFANHEIKTALFQVAKGFKCDDTKFATFEGQITDSRKIKRHYPPNVRAIQFWLINRDRDNWKPINELQPWGDGQDIADALAKLAESLPG